MGEEATFEKNQTFVRVPSGHKRWRRGMLRSRAKQAWLEARGVRFSGRGGVDRAGRKAGLMRRVGSRGRIALAVYAPGTEAERGYGDPVSYTGTLNARKTRFFCTDT